MVSRLVDEDAGNRTSEEEIVSSSEGPGVSERVKMETEISRLTTAQMVLGTRQTLFLPENHPLMSRWTSLLQPSGFRALCRLPPAVPLCIILNFAFRWIC